MHWLDKSPVWVKHISFGLKTEIYWTPLFRRHHGGCVLKPEAAKRNETSETAKTKRAFWPHKTTTTIETSGGGNVAGNVDFTSDTLSHLRFLNIKAVYRNFFFTSRAVGTIIWYLYVVSRTEHQSLYGLERKKQITVLIDNVYVCDFLNLLFFFWTRFPRVLTPRWWQSRDDWISPWGRSRVDHNRNETNMPADAWRTWAFILFNYYHWLVFTFIIINFFIVSVISLWSLGSFRFDRGFGRFGGFACFVSFCSFRRFRFAFFGF